MGMGAPASDRVRVLMTGATGYLGRAIVHQLRRDGRYELGAITRDADAARALLGGDHAGVFGYADALSGRVPYGRFDILLHAGFARPHHGATELAESLRVTGQLFEAAAQQGTRAIVNVSSRSVYGADVPVPWTEDSPPAPGTAYGMAKWASEILLQGVCARVPGLSGTSIRLGTVMGGGAGLVDVFVLARFVRKAIRSEPIEIRGGLQEFDVLDLQDASAAIVALLGTPHARWRPLYNLSSPRTYSIRLLAERCVAIATAVTGASPSPIALAPGDDRMRYVLDSSRFCEDTGWRAGCALDDTIRSLVDFYAAQGRA